MMCDSLIIPLKRVVCLLIVCLECCYKLIFIDDKCGEISTSPFFVSHDILESSVCPYEKKSMIFRKEFN